MPPKDQDGDYEKHGRVYFDKDDYSRPNYPYAADATVKRAVASVVKRYFAAAVAENGAAGCSLIFELFAEVIPEEYGEPPNATPALRGSTCAEVMTKVYKIHHKRLAAEDATLEVASVRLNNLRGLALLHFNGLPGRGIDVHLQQGVWKIEGLLDSEFS